MSCTATLAKSARSLPLLDLGGFVAGESIQAGEIGVLRQNGGLRHEKCRKSLQFWKFRGLSEVLSD